MPVSREQKQVQVEQLRNELSGASAVLVTSFEHLTVEQDLNLRRQVRAVGGRYRVVKNTLIGRATEGTAAAAVCQQLSGVTSIAYTGGDAAALAKRLQEYIKENPSLSFKAAVVEGRVLSVAEIAQLAALPSKPELYAKLLYLLQSPAQRLVTTLGAVGRQVVNVLDQAVKQEKFSRPA